MGDEPNAEVKVPKCVLRRPHKGRRFIKTAGRWPRKSASAKKCVTTYLPNESAPKMDGAQAHYRDPAVRVKNLYPWPGRALYILTSRRPGVEVVEKPRGDPRWNCLQCRSWW